MKRQNISDKPYIIEPKNHNDSSRNKSIMAEGINDEIIYERVKSDGWIIFRKTIDGSQEKSVKENIISNVKKRNQYFNRAEPLIGIVDRDYDAKERIDNLFYTDKNDVEATAIQVLTEDEAYQIFAKTFCGNYAKYEFRKLYNNTKIIANQFSNLWKKIHDYKKEHRTNISYLINLYKDEEKSLFSRIIKLDSESLMYEINYEELLILYKNKESNNYIQNMDTKRLQEIMQAQSNHFRGHDFFHILTYLLELETDINNNNLRYFEREYIKNSREKEWIKKTKLYRDVKQIGAFK